jgi:hypothetical protein
MAVTFRCKDVNNVLYVFFSKMYLIEIIIYQTADGQTQVDIRLENETV